MTKMVVWRAPGVVGWTKIMVLRAPRSVGSAKIVVWRVPGGAGTTKIGVWEGPGQGTTPSEAHSECRRWGPRKQFFISFTIIFGSLLFTTTDY